MDLVKCGEADGLTGCGDLVYSVQTNTVGTEGEEALAQTICIVEDILERLGDFVTSQRNVDQDDIEQDVGELCREIGDQLNSLANTALEEVDIFEHHSSIGVSERDAEDFFDNVSDLRPHKDDLSDAEQVMLWLGVVPSVLHCFVEIIGGATEGVRLTRSKVVFFAKQWNKDIVKSRKVILDWGRRNKFPFTVDKRDIDLVRDFVEQFRDRD